MTTEFTANRLYPKPSFDTRTWHDMMHTSLDMIDADMMGVGVVVPGATSALVGFTSKAGAAATIIPSTVNTIQTAGYSTPGDGGGAIYYKVGASTLGGFQSADGAWWALEKGVYNVREYGATGNDTTDDTAAIQAAINAASVDVNGGLVYFPAGQYRVSSTLIVAHSFITLQGEGRFNSTLMRTASFTTGDTVLFSAGGGVNVLYYVGVTDLGFDAIAASTSGSHISFNVCKFNLISNVILEDSYIGLTLISNQNFVIDDVKVLTSGLYVPGVNLAFAGLYLTTDATAAKKENTGWVNKISMANTATVAPSRSHGLYVDSADGIWLNDCYFGIAQSSNIRLLPFSSAVQVSGIRCINSWCDPGNGVSLDVGGTTAQYYGLISFIGCIFSGGVTGLIGIRFNAAVPVKNVIIQGCKINSYIQSAAQFGNVIGLVFEGNTVRDFASGGVAHGIQIQTGTDDYIISGNSIGYKLDGVTTNTFGYALILVGTKYIVTNNDLNGNFSGGIFDSGTGNGRIIQNNIAPEYIAPIASVASLILPIDGTLFSITGTTTITSIAAASVPRYGREVTFVFAGTLTLTNGNNLKLAANMITAVNDTIKLVYDGTNWVELTRNQAATGFVSGGVAGKGLMFSFTPNFGVFFGAGAPLISAGKGSLYLRGDGTTNVTRMYVNTDGATTWTGVNTVA